MAEITTKRLVDDMEDGQVEADGGRVSFSIEGRAYEIDLSVKNKVRFDADMQKYIDHARPVTGPRKRQKTAQPPTQHGASGYSGEQLTAVRSWARKNGWPKLSDRGRVPGEVRTAFEAAGGLSSPEFSNP